MSEEKYQKSLRDANMAESKWPKKSLDLLKACLEIIEKTRREAKLEIDLIKRRIGYLQQRVAKVGTQPIRSGSAAEAAVAVGVPPVIGKVSPIIESIYGKLKQKESVEYEDYLKFFQAAHSTIAKPLPPIIHDESPIIYYVGDTHGSYHESIIMINFFEQVILKHENHRIIFLGDYVDRNPQDLENISLILAFYLLHPKNVVILRGNHEDEDINRRYGFWNNLNENFVIGERVEEVYSLILDIFTRLPVAHIHNLKNPEKAIKIFATHGGIPVEPDDPDQPVVVDKVKGKLKRDAKTADEFDVYTNWLLWADPNETMEGFGIDMNTGRGVFGPDTFRKFMDANKFDFMVRAHEKLATGYKFFFNFNLISLFSTSFYNGKKIGEAAFLRLEPGKAPELLTTSEEKLKHEASLL